MRDLWVSRERRVGVEMDIGGKMVVELVAGGLTWSCSAAMEMVETRMKSKGMEWIETNLYGMLSIYFFS